MSDEIVKELSNPALLDSNGSVDPRKVVEFAQKNKTSALHGRFNWNLKAAAMEHWLLTARGLIRVHFVLADTGHGNKEPIRMFVSPKAEPDSGSRRGYVPTVEVLADPERRRNLVMAQLDRLWSIYKSYPLRELDAIGDAIESCRKRYDPVPMLEAAE